MRAEPAFGAAVRLLVPTTREAQIWVFCGTWDGRRWGLALARLALPVPGPRWHLAVVQVRLLSCTAGRQE
jgi:hypothetical protein